MPRRQIILESRPQNSLKQQLKLLSLCSLGPILWPNGASLRQHHTTPTWKPFAHFFLKSWIPGVQCTRIRDMSEDPHFNYIHKSVPCLGNLSNDKYEYSIFPSWLASSNSIRIHIFARIAGVLACVCVFFFWFWTVALLRVLLRIRPTWPKKRDLKALTYLISEALVLQTAPCTVYFHSVHGLAEKMRPEGCPSGC